MNRRAFLSTTAALLGSLVVAMPASGSPPDFAIASPQAVAAMSAPHCVLAIMAQNDFTKMLVCVRPSGEVEFGKDVRVSDAAKTFWYEIGLKYATDVCPGGAKDFATPNTGKSP